MYFIYVDESGDPGLINSPTRFYVLTALCIHESAWLSYFEQVSKFRRELRTTFGIRKSDEIHAGPLMTKPKKFSFLTRKQRFTVLKKHIDFMRSQKDSRILAVVIDKKRLQKEQFDAKRVVELAWNRLIQRFENTLSHRNFPNYELAREHGFIVADGGNDHFIRTVVRRMCAYNPVPHNVNAQKAGYRNLKLRLVITDPSFVDSRTNYLIQMADVAAWFLRQKYEPAKFIKSHNLAYHFDRLEPVMCKVCSKTHPLGIHEEPK